jgi:glycosyltransferase involved in cell wall biosynthesis
MRIAMLSSESAVGGAARAMRRLALGLTKRGHEVDILQLAGRPATAEAIRFEPAPGWPDGAALADFVDAHYIPRRRTPLSDTLFTAQSRGLDLSQVSWLRGYDVLNLHWVQFFLNPECIARLIGLGRPVVLTLHDMAGFTGGCHYSAGCEGYAEECAPCPQLNDDVCELPRALLAAKRQIFTRPNVAAVAPSRWLAAAAARSQVFAPGAVQQLWNSVETDLFRPGDRPAIRAGFGIGPEVRTILFGANNNGERRKGFRHLTAAMRRLRLEPEFDELARAGRLKILLFGQATPEIAEQGLPVLDLGFIADDRKLAEAYNAADLAVLPSLDDNQPNILLEAMACGTPVVAFAVGGLPDVIRDKANGRLVAPFDVLAFARAILDLLLAPAEAGRLGEAARRDIVGQAALDVQAAHYEALFERMLAARGPAAADGQLWLEAKAAARRQPTAVPCLVSPRITAPEVAAAHERFNAGIDRYITPELAAAAELEALRAERAEISRQLDEQARLLLGSRSWRLGRICGRGRGPTVAEIAAMGSVLEKLHAIWSVLRSRRWEAMAPLRLFKLPRRRP